MEMSSDRDGRFLICGPRYVDWQRADLAASFHITGDCEI
jgi:hypothetical protein